jgi:hypothetical protein
MTNTNTTIDAHALLDGWHSGIYKAGHVLKELSKLDGTGTFSQRVQQNLNGNGNAIPNDQPPPPPPQKPVTSLRQILQEGEEAFQGLLDGEYGSDRIAIIMINSGYDGSDPTNRIKLARENPENNTGKHRIMSFLEDRAEKAEYYNDLSDQAKNLFNLILEAWKIWIRKRQLHEAFQFK